MSSSTKRRYSIDELRSIVEPVAKQYGVAKIYLFGSVARGDCDDDSDYDFCIESGTMRDMFTLSGFFQDLKYAVGREIDLVDIKALDSDFLNIVLSEGVILYEG
ncbi:MAG: nucleotidyltransferase domain-containing protein [Candidatus Methanoplasma sp.]|jgi:predicted nucleotidyltransferase|nr:nucleotidyltransferase domain-containing protein [Candidatus Methanoplasma sp.]